MVTLVFPIGSVATIEKSRSQWIVTDVNTAPVVLDITDLDGDGFINNAEWDAEFAGVQGLGNNVGDTFYGFVGNGSAGTLYATNGSVFTVGENVTTIRNSLDNSFELDLEGVVCFTPDALIETRKGLRPAAQVQVGDWVLTRDDGFQQVRWVGQRRLSRDELRRNTSLRPVTVRKDSFGKGVPDRDLHVSPQHRLLIEDWRATYLFDTSEVLVSAVSMVDDTRIRHPAPPDAVTYIHLMFDQHQIIRSNNMWTESFFPTDYSLRLLEPSPQQELFTLFPELAANSRAYGPTARLTPSGRAAKVLRAL